MANPLMSSPRIPVEEIRIDAQMALELIGHEAIIRQAYKDSVNKWTWGIGMTSATGHKVERYIDKPQDLFVVLSIGLWALNNYAEGVRKRFAGQRLTREEFTAALSFHWNTGAIGKASWVKLFIDGRFPQAEASFLEWDNPPEIKGRREKEANLLFRGVWSNDGRATEYQVTKNHTPKWSSAKRIDITAEINRAIGAQMGVHVDTPPQPDAPVTQPTIGSTPPVSVGTSSDNSITGIAAGVLAVLAALAFTILKGFGVI